MKVKSLLNMGIAMVAVALATAPALANGVPVSVQDQSDDDRDGKQADTAESDANASEIVVTGIRGSLEDAAKKKKNAKQIVDSVYAEDVGKLPDNNVVEALARVTGVQITRERGEGSSVTIRGLGDVQTTINGNNTNLGSGRSLDLSTIPAELLKSVDVYKTRTADQVEGSISGTVNVELRRPLDLNDGLTVAGSIRGSYNDVSKQVSPYASLLVAEKFDTGIGEIGLMANASYTRNFYFENYIQSETPAQACCTDPDGNAIANTPLDSLPVDQQDAIIPYRAFYGLERGDVKRPSINLVAQWAPSDELDFVLEGTYFGARENRASNRLYLQTRDAQIDNLQLEPDGVTAKSLTVVSPNGVPGGVDSIYNQFRQDFYNTNFEMHWHGERAQINASAQYSWSNESYYFVEQILRFYNQTTANIQFDSDIVDKGAPLISFPGTDLTDPASYGVDRFQDNGGGSKNKEFAGQVDLTLKLSDDNFLRSFQGGFRIDTRNASRYYGYRDGFPRVDGQMAPLVQFPGGSQASLVSPSFDGSPQWLQIPGSVLMDNIGAIRSYIQQTDPGNAERFSTVMPPSDRGQTFTTNENNFAFYGQLNYAFDVGVPVDGVAGVRVVNTWGKVQSFVYQPDTTGENGYQDYVSNETGRGNYLDILPSVNAIVHFTDKLQLRLAYTFNVQRPGFYDLRPFAYLETRATPPIVYAGNPDLVAQTETNYDASLEYYFGRAGQITANVYWKKPKDFLYYSREVENLEPYGLPGQGYVEQLRNAGDGEFVGFEFAAQSFFDFLPGFWRNFGASANFSYIPRFRINYPFDDETAQIPGVFDSPGTSKYTANAALYYDTPEFSARLAYNYRSRRRDFVLTQNPGYSPYTDATSRLDAAINYTPVKFLTLSLEATNLLNNDTFQYFGADHYLPLGIRDAARTFQLSARFRL